MSAPIADPKTTDPKEIETPKVEPQEPEKEPAPAFAPITSQEEFDKTLGKRLVAERAKYAGFDDLKAKAAKFDELEESKKTETQRLSDQLAAATKERDELKLNQLRSAVASDKGLPPKLARRLSGTTREELEADAEDLLEGLPPKPESEPEVRISSKPKENLRGGGRPDEIEDEFDVKKVVAKIPRR